MNHAKKANILFLTVVTISVLAHVFVAMMGASNVNLPIVVNLLLSQSFILVPGLIFFITNKDEQVVRVRKIKFVTFLMLILFTELLMPLVSAVNAFSQFFTDNVVVSISDQVVDVSFPLMLFIIGIIGPMSEEFVFRGMIFMGLKKSSNRFVASGLLSALFFGLMHMNLNQCAYAFVLGFIFALIDDALESIWPSVIAHCVVNSQNVILLYGLNYMIKLVGDGESLEQIAGNSNLPKSYIFMTFCIVATVALFTTSLAALLFYAICSVEKRSGNLKGLFIKNPEKESGKVLYIAGIIGIIVCVCFMFALEPLISFISKLNL